MTRAAMIALAMLISASPVTAQYSADDRIRALEQRLEQMERDREDAEFERRSSALFNEILRDLDDTAARNRADREQREFDQRLESIESERRYESIWGPRFPR